LEALFFSTAVVALAEMGDKTQLLSFVLAAKLKRKVPIALGILFATLANHSLAGYVGTWLADLVSPEALRWIIAVSFFPGFARSAEMDYRRIVFCLRFVGAQAG
jgi:putative Ca2+/H+ antiporter (TMEM165/GDT1 family)